MKYLKLYENLFKREKEYEYLDKSEVEILSEYITPIIKDTIEEGIKNIEIDDYEEANFNYRYVVDNFFRTKFYLSLYKFSKEKFNRSTPAIHNSFVNILDYYNFENKVYYRLSDKLIELFENDPERYKECYIMHEDDLDANVKEKMKWALDKDKFNL